MLNDEVLLNNLVEIKVTRAGQDKPFGYATGFPVGTNRVLTCLHVCVGKVDKIEVRLPARSKEWLAAAVSVAWPADAAELTPDSIPVDVALLAVELPKEAVSGVISSRRPQPHRPWNGHAFPAGSSKDDRGYLRAHPLIGSVAGATSAQSGEGRELQLNVLSEPDKREQWQGASGGPVVVDGELCAVLRAYQSNWGNSLYAVPTWVLLRDGSFVSALGSSDSLTKLDRHRSFTIERFTRRLKGSIKLSEVFADVVESPAEPAVLVAQLMALELLEFCGACGRAHQRLMEDRHAQEAKEVVAVLEEVTPLLVDQALVQVVASSGGGVLLELPFVTPIMADLVTAAADRRTVKLGKPKSRSDLLRCEGQLELDGEEVGKSPKAATDAIRDRLLTQLTHGSFKGEGDVGLDRALRNELRALANPKLRDRPFRYFYAYPPLPRETLVAQDLSQRFPEIRTIAMLGSDADGTEQMLARVLVDFLLLHYSSVDGH